MPRMPAPTTTTSNSLPANSLGQVGARHQLTFCARFEYSTKTTALHSVGTLLNNAPMLAEFRAAVTA